MILSGLATTLSGRDAFAGHPNLLLFSGITFSAMHLLICLHGIKQVPVNSQLTEKEIRTNTSTATSEEIERRLLAYFDSNKPWLKSDLKIWDVVVSLRTNRTYLSKLINENLNSNFNDFVNTYRIREAQSIIEKDVGQSLSLQAIAEMSGFGSVSSFARAFRKITKRTPSEFRKEVTKPIENLKNDAE